MKVFYIAGPYRAKTERGVLDNIRAAEAVAIRVWEAGHAALCPHLNSRLMGGVCPDEVFLEGDLELMKMCDAVVLIPGWEKSKGTLAEVEIARKLNMPIYLKYDKVSYTECNKDS